MATKLGTALRQKFSSPREVIHALGLDESLLRESKENLHMAKTPTRFANLALQMTARALRPVLAKDAKIDLMPIFRGVTTKNFKAHDVRLALDSALKGKLAKDASIEHVADMLDHLEHVSRPETADESLSEAQHNAMEAAAHGESNLGIPKKVGEEFSRADKGKSFDAEPLKSFMREKGMSEDDIAEVEKMLPKAEAEDEDQAEKRDNESEGERLREREDRERAATDEDREDMVTKPAMDAALKATADETAKRIRQVEHGIRVAIAEVEPWVGKVSPTQAFDSADDVYRFALKTRKVDGADTMHADALRPVLKSQPLPGAKPVVRAEAAMGMDAAIQDKMAKRFPGIERIG